MHFLFKCTTKCRVGVVQNTNDYTVIDAQITHKINAAVVQQSVTNKKRNFKL